MKIDVDFILENLIKDLANEYSHWHFYIQASTNVVGLHRLELSEFFEKQASSEMNHVLEFRKLIQGLITKRNLKINIPNEVAKFKENLKDPIDLLSFALEMEDKVVSNYTQRIKETCLFQENNETDAVDGKYIELFLEDQIQDSRADADEIREILKRSIDF